MKTSWQGVVALARREGIVPGPYLDSVGVWTCFIGHTRSAGAPDPARLPRGRMPNLDEAIEEAVNVFVRDLAKYEARVNNAVKVPVKQHEFDAMVSFDFNTGAIHKAEFVKSLNDGDRAKAVRQIMNWVKPPEVISRREEEQAQFRDGTVSNKGVPVWDVRENGRVIYKPIRTVSPTELARLARPSADEIAVPASRPKTTTTQKVVGLGYLLVAIGATIAAFFEKIKGWLGG